MPIAIASGALTQDDMAANVAGTSPFLKEMLGTFIEAGGRKAGKAQGLVVLDELGWRELLMGRSAWHYGRMCEDCVAAAGATAATQS